MRKNFVINFMLPPHVSLCVYVKDKGKDKIPLHDSSEEDSREVAVKKVSFSNGSSVSKSDGVINLASC